MSKNCWNTYNDNTLKELDGICTQYVDDLTHCKTERECVAQFTRELRKSGYVSLEEFKASGKKLETGDKVYYCQMGKSLIAFNLGSEPLEARMNIHGAHIDSPRLDVKQNPLYETEGCAYLDTHYYGGIRKYHWLAIPLAIHGVICKADGTTVTVSIGEDEGEPRFVITDLLPHLASKQCEKKVIEAFEGEKLDLLVGSKPAAGEDKDDAKQMVRDNILKLLADKYGITEDDFTSSELEIVPAGKACDCGLDRSMIMAYGQDDKVYLKVYLNMRREQTACSLSTKRRSAAMVQPACTLTILRTSSLNCPPFRERIHLSLSPAACRTPACSLQM